MSAMDVLIMVALAVWTAVGLGILVAVVRGYPLMVRLQGILHTMDDLVEMLDRHLEPTLHRVDRIADDVQDMTVSLRSDVEALGDTVERASRSADRIVERAERRAAEIDGLVELIQEEVEESFLRVGSVLRGVRGLGERFGLGGGRAERASGGDRERRRSG